MAKWRVTPKTQGNTLRSAVEYDDHGSNWMVEQDISHVLEAAKRDREREQLLGKSKQHYRKFASIPEVVAIEINQLYGIDLFAPEFMHDEEMKARFFRIIETEYPHLKTTETKFT